MGLLLGSAASTSASDWSSRSTGDQILVNERFDTEATVTNTATSGGAGGSLDDDDGGVYGDHHVWDQGPDNGGLIPTSTDGGSGVLRFNIYYYDTSGRGNWITPEWSETFDTAGDEFWCQFRVWHTFNHANYAHRGSGSSNESPHGEGFKTAIVSNWPSNQVYEIVMQKLSNYGLVRGYHQQDGGTFVRGWDQSYNSSEDANDNRLQVIDAGGAESTYAQQLRRYAGLHSYQRDEITVEDFPFIRGRPDPFTPGFKYYPNEWLTFQVHVEIVTASTTRYTWYAMRERDSAFTQISPVVTETSMTPEYNRLWLLPYETQGAAESGGDSWGPWSGQPITSPRRQTSHVAYQSVIVSTEEIAAPPARENYTVEDEILALSTGAWDQNPFTMTGYNTTLLDAGNNRILLEYGCKGFYDPFRRELIFKGGGHSDATSNGVIRYDMAANSWSRSSGISSPWYLHGYERSAFDTTTGRFFTTDEGSSSQAFYEFDYSDGTWDTLTTMNNFEGGFQQIAPAIEYFPELHGIVQYHSGRGLGLYNLELGTWTDIGLTTQNNYHSLARYNPVLAEMMIVSGNSGAGTVTMWILDRFGNTTTARNLPSFDLGPDGGMVLVCEDPDSQYYGQYIAFERGQSGSLGYEVYDSIANTWTSLGSHSIYTDGTDPHRYAAISIPTVHGAMFLTGNSSNANFYLYRMPQ